MESRCCRCWHTPSASRFPPQYRPSCPSGSLLSNKRGSTTHPFVPEGKDALYSLSYLTGATRSDSWVDIEGGIGTLMAYASIGSNDFPSGNVVHEGPAFPLGKKGGFAGTHILVPRGGIAVHINAFNFPVWGLLEKFAPAFLAGMPCIAKPATATSFLTEALVRQIDDSGILL